MRALRAILLGTALGGLAGRATAQQRVVIADVTIIDGTGAPPRPHMSVIVERGRIARITTASEKGADIPPDALVVDGGGKFLIPGLWDMHVHLAKAGANTLPLFVANGVTSVRDVGGDYDATRAMRDDIAAGRRVGPRIKTAGPILESAERYDRLIRSGTIEPVARSRVRISDSTSAARAVDSLARLGVDLVKFRSVPSLASYRSLAAAARRAGLPIAGHGDAVGVDEMILAGQRSIEHAILWPLQWKRAAERHRIIRGLVANDVAVIPTLVNFHHFFQVSRQRALAIVNDSLGARDPRRRFICCYLIEDWREQMEDLGGRISLRRPIFRGLYHSVRKDLREMHRAGVAIMPGTDVAVAMIYPGFSLHDELRYLVEEIGMSPMQALTSATRAPARWFGMADSLGTIEPGKIADLVLLSANPLANIANTQRIVGVMVAGRYLDRMMLNQLLEQAASDAKIGKRD